MARQPAGWRKDPARHSLAARGVKTGHRHGKHLGPWMKPTATSVGSAKVERAGLTTFVSGPSKDALKEADTLGSNYGEWDEDQLAQSAELANDIAPEIRRLAGYVDHGMGTYTDTPPGVEPDEITWIEEDLWQAFKAGYEKANAAWKYVHLEEEKAMKKAR